MNLICIQSDDMSTFCDDVMTLPDNGRLTSNTQLGRQTVDPPCAPPTGLPGKDVVVLWQPTVSNSYRIRIEGSHPNAILSVYNDCTASRQLLNCDDDSGSGLNSELTIFGAADTDYYVVVSSASDLYDGQFELVIEPVMNEPEEPECTFSNNSECGAGLVCWNGECLQESITNLCGRSESLIGGSRRNGRCDYPQVIEGNLDRDRINDCFEDGYEGNDAHWRWQPCRPGRYRLSATSEISEMDISLAIYTECNTSRTYEIACKNTDQGSAETVEVVVAPNYFLANDPYGLFHEIVISGRNEDSVGEVLLTIECLEGDCLN